MATLYALKQALREKAGEITTSPREPLCDAQYEAAFSLFMQQSEYTTYQEFIIPQLHDLLVPLLESSTHISVLEIGPGPRSVLGSLPYRLRSRIKSYVAFEPNSLFAARLREWLQPPGAGRLPLPCLNAPPDIREMRFVPSTSAAGDNVTNRTNERFDLVLFCHSLYGMKPKRESIEHALEMLVDRPGSGMVMVFHRDEPLELGDLVCHRAALFPTGTASVDDEDEALDHFASFIAGFVVQEPDAARATRQEWRNVCRMLAGRQGSHPTRLSFSAPAIMVAFTRYSTRFPEIIAQVPGAGVERKVKNREAHWYHPASIVRPTDIQHVQPCVEWARRYQFALTVLGGGHSGHCLWPHVVSIDMGAFNQVHIVRAEGDGDAGGSDSGDFVVAESGCKTGDIIKKAMEAGLTVPLGARPSVGAGLWLQGGIGHLARVHGLACDAIVGAVMVSVDSGLVFYIGHVPVKYRPTGAIRPENEEDLLWAIKGAGTNIGIVISVTFKAYGAPTYVTRNWVTPMRDSLDAQLRLEKFDAFIAQGIPRTCSVDTYLYWEVGRLHLGITMTDSTTTPVTSDTTTLTTTPSAAEWGPANESNVVDGMGLFETELYMSAMHGGHGRNKTSAFKRCVFLKGIGTTCLSEVLVRAVETCPSPLCYLHLLQGGGAVQEVAAGATAFGCRDWDFACVITGVWPRDQDGTDTSRAATQWVYRVANELLPLSSGVYGADLGPDFRDASLATRAFGPNLMRLAQVKQSSDPYQVLPYTCPLTTHPVRQKVIILVTGKMGAGKDYCADVWASVFNGCTQRTLTARVVSISTAIKKEYAAATGADLDRILFDRAYKEQHRPVLTKFFQEQVLIRPRLPEEHFLNVASEVMNVDVLFITGMRDQAPVTSFAHLVPDTKLIDVCVLASDKCRRVRRGYDQGEHDDDQDDGSVLDYSPSFLFENEVSGSDAAKQFAQTHLLPFVHEDFQTLAGVVRCIPDFPRTGIEFRHVLDISQQPGGLTLCTSLLKAHSTHEWAKIHRIVCCEAGGFVYASALASQVDIPLALVREVGKLPPPTISAPKPLSHISRSLGVQPRDVRDKTLEMAQGLIPRGASVLVVDDVLATGETLCAVLQILDQAGVDPAGVSIIVVAEFPVHQGREQLRRRGFGKTNIKSLLVFDGA